VRLLGFHYKNIETIALSPYQMLSCTDSLYVCVCVYIQICVCVCVCESRFTLLIPLFRSRKIQSFRWPGCRLVDVKVKVLHQVGKWNFFFSLQLSYLLWGPSGPPAISLVQGSVPRNKVAGAWSLKSCQCGADIHVWLGGTGHFCVGVRLKQRELKLT